MHCLVLWCSNKGKIPGINYFCLTKKRHDAWLMALGRDPYVQQLSERNVICSKHFSPEDILHHHDGKRIRLRPNAVPKFYLRKRDFDLEQGSSRAFQEMHQEGDDLFEEFPVKIEKHDLDLDSYDSCNYSHEKIYMDDFEAQFLDDKKYIPGLSTSCSPSLETAQSSHSLETSAPEESATDSEDDKEKTKTAIQEILIRHNYWKDLSQEENIDDGNRPNQGVSIKTTLPSSAGPMHAAKVKCLGNISKNINEKRSYNLTVTFEQREQRRANETAEQRERRLEKQRQRRANETVEQREQRERRLEKQRQRRAKETVEQREQRLKDLRELANQRRANETVEQREQRLKDLRELAKQRRANETVEQREQRLEYLRQRTLQHRANETVEQREQRLEYIRQRASQLKANKTIEQREPRRKKLREWGIQRRANETVEQREQRLEKVRQRGYQRRANETVEQREQRLENLRKCASQRRANETVEQREQRLEKKRQYRANLTVEQRKQHLEYKRQRYLRRMANETVEQHAQRLERIRQRRANETVEQREQHLEAQAQRQLASGRMANEIVEKRVELSFIPSIASLPKSEVKFFTAPDETLGDDSRVAPTLNKIPEAGSDVLCQPE